MATTGAPRARSTKTETAAPLPTLARTEPSPPAPGASLARRAARDVSANVFKKKAKVAAKAKTAAPKRSSSSSGEEGLWLPNTARPEWLDGSLPGDRGFDPLGLAKPTEYIQVRGGERRGEGGGERERGIIWV